MSSASSTAWTRIVPSNESSASGKTVAEPSIVIDPPEGHLRTYLQSLDRLLTEPIGTLYPAHGPAMRLVPALSGRGRHAIDSDPETDSDRATGEVD